MRTFAYIRVSTADQNLEKNRAAILAFAERHGWPAPTFVCEKISGRKPWKERRLGKLVSTMRQGDRLITSELSRLGRSVVRVLDVLSVLSEAGVEVWSCKESAQLNGSGITALVNRTVLSLLAELERTLISERTKEALSHAKAKGVRLGRPARSRLDPKRAEIVRAFLAGTPIMRLAQEYQISACAMRGFLKRNKLVK
jgi:DNA invertase Pin-like site-specific DNA recombinase